MFKVFVDVRMMLVVVWVLTRWGFQHSIFQLCHFSPEDGDNMRVRIVGIDLLNYTVPKLKTPSRTRNLF
jgi:hypothetical protein